MMADTWALLWSQRQNAMHIETLADVQRNNTDAFTANRPGDYVLMGLGSREQCEAGAHQLRPILAQRELGIEGPRAIGDVLLERIGLQAGEGAAHG